MCVRCRKAQACSLEKRKIVRYVLRKEARRRFHAHKCACVLNRMCVCYVCIRTRLTKLLSPPPQPTDRPTHKLYFHLASKSKLFFFFSERDTKAKFCHFEKKRVKKFFFIASSWKFLQSTPLRAI